MKSIRMLFMLALLIVSTATSVLAEENVQSDELTSQDVAEVQTLRYTLGAELRLMQLERAMTQNALMGAKVIEQVQARNAEADTAEMEVLLEEYEALLDEVKSLDAENEDVAVNYVDMKKQALELAQQFREQAGPLLTEEDRTVLQQERQQVRTQLQDMQSAIDEVRGEYNQERVRTMMQNMNIQDEALLQRVRDHQEDAQQIREKIAEHLQEMTQEQRQNALRQYDEEKMQGETLRERVVEQVKSRIQTVREERRTQLENSLLQRRATMAERMSATADRNGYDELSERLSDYSDRLNQRIDDRSKASMDATGGSQ